MGLFDSVGDLTVTGDYAAATDTPVAFNFSESFGMNAGQLFPEASNLPDGITLIDQRTNTSWWDFDQSKITNKLQDILGSVTDAGIKTGLQLAGDAINKNANNQNPTIASWFQNFRSTSTGAQINAAGYATRVQNFFANPVVWLAGIVVVLFFLMRR